MHSIEKEYKFEYAHRLMNHKGDCKNIHGHSARIKVEIFSIDINEHTGMIIDFGHLGFISSYFDQKFDHTLILNNQDPLFHLLKDSEIGKDFKIRMFQGEPTSENFARAMAYDILVGIEDKERNILNLPVKIEKIKITFWETAKNSATFTLKNT